MNIFRDIRKNIFDIKYYTYIIFIHYSVNIFALLIYYRITLQNRLLITTLLLNIYNG